jgi:hypothetical protein
MTRFSWIALTAIRTLISRLVQGRDLWGWHHHKMATNPTYARFLIDGLVKALWQPTFDAFLRTLSRTAIEVAQARKHHTID